MRLTCPNCDAQYEVPDEVIPDGGRDVQCSNCGDTWFQSHPDFPNDEAAKDDDQPEPTVPPDQEPASETLREAFGKPSQSEEPPQQQEIPEGVSEILREEAEREAQLRADETSEPLESQPDLGLDNMPGDESARRAQQASDRMARMKGQTASDADLAADSESRREMLPDIEEINSSLRASDESAGALATAEPHRATSRKKKRGGFARGFALIMILGVVAALVYINAPKISGAVPQAEPVLNSYVSLVNQGRGWLDAQLQAFTPPKPEE